MKENTQTTAPLATTVEKRTNYRFVLVIMLFAAIFVGYLDRVNIYILAANDPFTIYMGIKDEPVKIGMMMSAFMLSYGLANVLFSPLGDWIGPRKTMLLGVVLWEISLIIGGLAGAFSMIIASRILLGIGEGFYYPMQVVFVKNWFPAQERGRANAVWMLGHSVAPAVAMPLFAYIVGAYGWRSSYLLCVILGLIPLILLWFYVTDTPREHKKVNALELKHIESGLNRSPAEKLSEEKPTFWQRSKVFIYDYRFWLLLVAFSCHLCVAFGLYAWLPSYLKSARAFSWAQMGWLSSLPFIAGIFGKLISGWAIDRLGRCMPVIAVASLISGITMYFGATISNNFASAYIIAVSIGFIAFVTPASFTALQNLFSAKTLGTATGFMNGISQGVAALAPMVTGFFIGTSFGYTGGLFFLVAMAVVGAISAGILTFTSKA